MSRLIAVFVLLPLDAGVAYDLHLDRIRHDTCHAPHWYAGVLEPAREALC